MPAVSAKQEDSCPKTNAFIQGRLESPRDRMASGPSSSESAHHSEIAAEDSSTRSARPRMFTRNRLLVFLTAWLIVLMPFLFWLNTWFGLHLSDGQIPQ